MLGVTLDAVRKLCGGDILIGVGWDSINSQSQ